VKSETIRVEPLSTYLENWKAPTSAVTRSGDTIYVSGFPPFDPDTGKVIEAPIERQTELVLEQMKLCLETAGSSLENVINAILAIAMLALLWVATGTAVADAPDAGGANAIGALLLKVQAWSTTVGATVFAVGSTLYSYLFLRARSIPVPLAWLGVLASVLLVVALPLEGIQLIKGPMVGFIWLPMLVFEVTLALWLLIKGVAAPATR
jgi:hypothetical protein